MLFGLADKSPEIAAKLHKFMNLTSGRQALETLYPDLHEAITDHVIAGACADSRRRIVVLTPKNPR